MTERMPTYFIAHGGGPWPWIPEMSPMYAELTRALQAIPDELPETPTSIVVVSAHWEAPEITVQTSPNPTMLYDYGGFPAHTYEISYPAPGDPAMAQRVLDLLADNGIVAHTDDQRGFDHGMFVPLYVSYPEADVPMFQLSLRRGLDPAEHLAVGRALAPLRDEGVLIVGSGYPSFHDLRAFGPQSRAASQAFDSWLTETLVATDPAERTERLLEWDSAPAARLAHPREEHLIPVMIAVGAAEQDPGALQYHEDAHAGWMASSSYRFGG